MKCTICDKEKNIIYWDSFKTQFSKGVIRLCYNCLKYLGWDTELKKLMPQIKTCPICQQKYISKNPASIKCGLCWAKFFNNIPQQIKESKIDNGLMSYV